MTVSRIGPSAPDVDRRPDLLVVEQRRDREMRARCAGGQRRRCRPARQLIVQPSAGDQRSVGAEHGRPLHVVQAQLPERRVDAGPISEPAGERLGARICAARRPHRSQVDVLVEEQALLVDVAVEVDRQLRHAGDRLVDVHERRGTVAADDPSGDAEVAVEPAVQQRPAVDLDAELNASWRSPGRDAGGSAAPGSRCGRRRSAATPGSASARSPARSAHRRGARTRRPARPTRCRIPAISLNPAASSIVAAVCRGVPGRW